MGIIMIEPTVMINGMKDASRYSDRIRQLENQCFTCGWLWKIGTDMELEHAVSSIGGHVKNKHLARWKYHDTLKKKLPACPNCGNRVIIHIPTKEN